MTATNLRSRKNLLRVPRETLLVRANTTRSMQANRSKETSPEIRFRKALWAAGLRGYRKNVRALPGKPDIVFAGKLVAVFVHGCFWHRCPKCRKDANFNTNEAFWRAKLSANVTRDSDDERELREIHFKVVVVWECEVKKNLELCVQRVKDALCLDDSK